MSVSLSVCARVRERENGRVCACMHACVHMSEGALECECAFACQLLISPSAISIHLLKKIGISVLLFFATPVVSELASSDIKSSRHLFQRKKQTQKCVNTFFVNVVLFFD